MSTPHRDQTLYCARCGISFFWPKEEQSRTEAEQPIHCAGCRYLLPSDPRQRGVIKWFNARKRFGFIAPYEGKDIFLHGSEVRKKSRLRPGDLVEFSLKDSDRGKVAANVELLPFQYSDPKE